jgi:hypothetical protein
VNTERLSPVTVDQFPFHYMKKLATVGRYGTKARYLKQLLRTSKAMEEKMRVVNLSALVQMSMGTEMMKQRKEAKQRERRPIMKEDEESGNGNESKDDSGNNGSHNKWKAVVPARMTRLEYKPLMKVRYDRAYLSPCSYGWLTDVVSWC